MYGRQREVLKLGRLRCATAWLLLTLLSAIPALALERPVRIGVLTAAWGPPGGLGGFVEGLIDLGYRENEDFVIGVRFTQGDISALPAAARAMVEGGVDLLLADDEPAIKAVQAATSKHPIIFLGVGDPIGRGLIASYNRPGGNSTGVADLDLEVSGKRLQLFKDLIPGLERVLLPYDKHNNYDAAQAALYRAAAQRLRIELVERQLENMDQARAVLAEVRREDIDGMLALQDVSLNIPGLVLEFAQTEGIPAMFASSVYLAGGGVASYGGSRDAAGRQAARLATRSSGARIPQACRPRRYRPSSWSSISGLRTGSASSSLAKCCSRRIGSFGDRLVPKRQKEALNMKTLSAIRAAATILVAAVLSVPGGATALEVGDKAPDFELPATTGGTIRLSDYLGKSMVLVEFYHTDWGPTCTANLLERRDDFDKFQALGVQILGISLDHAYSQASFAQSLGLSFPLLSDFPHGRTVRAYGIDYYEGEAKRLYARPSFFLIDKDGILRGYWGQRPRNPDEVLAPDPLFSSEPIFQVAQAIVQ